MNNINDFGNSLCTGCQMCACVCPFDAISINLDSDGFYMPCINEELCKNCGVCKNICSKFDTSITANMENRGVYAFKHPDKTILKKVSSGGAAYKLAQIAVDNGYLIAGTVYDYEHNNAKMEISNDPNDYVGSKYIQAFVGKVYKDLSKSVKSKYIVFGTPCQIYALDKVMRQKNIRERFILVDFFCHGCPSMLLWNKYIDEYKKMNMPEKIKKVEFRSKTRAWHEYCICVNGIPQKNSELFYDLFFSDKILNASCYNCRIRGSLDYADIRIGDFWGDKYDGDREGVSVLIAASDAGERFVGKLTKEGTIAKHKLEDVMVFQSCERNNSYDEILRGKIFDALKSDKNINEVLKTYYSSLSLIGNIKRVMKKFISSMPFSLRAFLRKKVHSRQKKGF